MTTERLTSILNGIGKEISKRQGVRILTSGLEDSVAQDVMTGLVAHADSAFPSQIA